MTSGCLTEWSLPLTIGQMAELSLSRKLLDASRSLADEATEALRDRGITDLRPSQAAALLLVDRMGGTRLSDLAQRADVTKQAMMQVVDDLASIGCVRRTPDLNDAR